MGKTVKFITRGEMKEYIEREAVNALIEAECSPKVAAFLNHAIDNIPAADVRPVVRGKWKLVGSVFPMYECDQCRAISLGGNFCPNCGADMREER